MRSGRRCCRPPPAPQPAVRAGHPGAGQIEQREPVGVDRRAQVPIGQRGLDGVLALEKPIHRRIRLVGADLGQAEVSGQGGVGPPAGGGQLRTGPADSRDVAVALIVARVCRPTGPSRFGRPSRWAWASLAGKTLLVAGEELEVTRSLPHGHVAAVPAQAQRLGLPNLLGPVGRQRDVAVALIVARVCRPGSKLATTRWWTDTTLAADLGLTEVSTDEAYAAMDWLLERQDAIEAALADRHLSAPVNPDRLALFDLSSSWMTGSHCPLAARGYSRDGKKGLPQIEYGLLTDPVGRPVAVRVVAGNTADPTAFAHLATDVRDRFGLTDLVLVGDRGMITKARIEQLRDLGGLGWVTALRAPDVAALARDDGPLQMSLFDQAIRRSSGKSG